MEYTIYKTKLDCGHIENWSDMRPVPKGGEEEYCCRCKDYRRVTHVYPITRDIDDIEEMLE